MDQFLCIFIADNTCEASVNKNAEIDMFNCKIVIFITIFSKSVDILIFVI